VVGLIEGDRSRARATRARKIKRNLDGRYRAWHYRDKGSFGEKLTQEILLCLCSSTNAPNVSASTKKPTGIFWLDPGNPGRVYVYLSQDDAAGAADQFSRYGILQEMELPGPGDDRISAVTFECDLAVMIEKMLDGGFSDPEKEMADWLLVLQHCSKRLREELLKVQGEEGPPPRF